MIMSAFEMVYVRKAPFFNVFDKQLHDRTGILTTVLFWNTFALIVGTVHIYKLFDFWNLPMKIIFSGIGGALIFAILGDMVPKTLAVVWTEIIFKALVYPFMAFYYIVKLSGLSFVASKILTSKYSREEVIEFILQYVKEHADKEDIYFVKRTLKILQMPAKTIARRFEGEDVEVELDESATCFDAINEMRRKGISRVKIGSASVFDLHDFMKFLVSQP